MEVSNPGTAFEVRAPTPTDEPGGFGLVIVDRLASRWGVDDGGDTASGSSSTANGRARRRVRRPSRPQAASKHATIGHVADPDLQTAIDELYGTALESFVAERKRLAKDLRTAGDREGAQELAKLPKPSLAAWSLNHVARQRSEMLGEWLDTTDELRETATNARTAGGAAIRAASQAHRTITEKLLREVRDLARPNGRPPTEPTIDRVRDLLRAAAADPELTELLRRGRLVEREVAPPDLSALLPDSDEADESSSGAPRRRRPERKPKPEPDAELLERERRRAELERQVGAAVAEVDRRRSTVAERAHAAATADERLEDARRTLHRTESEASAAHEAVADAELAAAEAERGARGAQGRPAPRRLTVAAIQVLEHLLGRDASVFGVAPPVVWAGAGIVRARLNAETAGLVRGEGGRVASLASKTVLGHGFGRETPAFHGISSPSGLRMRGVGGGPVDIPLWEERKVDFSSACLAADAPSPLTSPAVSAVRCHGDAGACPLERWRSGRARTLGLAGPPSRRPGGLYWRHGPW